MRFAWLFSVCGLVRGLEWIFLALVVSSGRSLRRITVAHRHYRCKAEQNSLPSYRLRSLSIPPLLAVTCEKSDFSTETLRLATRFSGAVCRNSRFAAQI